MLQQGYLASVDDWQGQHPLGNMCQPSQTQEGLLLNMSPCWHQNWLAAFLTQDTVNIFTVFTGTFVSTVAHTVCCYMSEPGQHPEPQGMLHSPLCNAMMQ